MTAATLVEALEARGARLTAREDGALLVEPRGILQDVEREALRAHKAAVLALLKEREARHVPGVDWTTVPLYSLTKVLEIIVPFADVPLVLAPGCRVAAELRSRDPRPGRVWCVCEVLDLLLSGVRPVDARKVAAAKLLLRGTVAGVRQGREA